MLAPACGRGITLQPPRPTPWRRSMPALGTFSFWRCNTTACQNIVFIASSFQACLDDFLHDLGLQRDSNARVLSDVDNASPMGDLLLTNTYNLNLLYISFHQLSSSFIFCLHRTCFTSGSRGQKACLHPQRDHPK